MVSILKTVASRLTNSKSGFYVSIPVFVKNEGVSFYCPPNDSSIRAIVEFPNEITQAVVDELSKTDRHVYIDLGANIGDTSFPIAKRFPNKRIIAVEPISFLADAMKQTKDRNKIENIEIVCAAVSNKKTLEMYIPKFGKVYISGLASGGINPKAGNIPKDNLSYKQIKVNTVTLDSLIEKNKIDPNDIALIKIDVEGAEPDVIISGKKH